MSTKGSATNIEDNKNLLFSSSKSSLIDFEDGERFSSSLKSENSDFNKNTLEFTEFKDNQATLMWKNINVWAQSSGIKGSCCNRKPNRFRQILYDLSGIAFPGRMLGILATSGSGKTTLLNFLAGMMPSNLRHKGNIFVNGKKINIKEISAYVQQTDLFYRLVTVREHLIFHAQLRIGNKMSYKEKLNRVDVLLKEFKLYEQRNMILNEDSSIYKGLSGGEKRRLTIITELLTDPLILFVDEPTSCLDSYLAENVVSSLKMMAEAGKTIICTIHQPSTDIFNLFDDLIMLSGGNSVYKGTVPEALQYFENMGYPCPQHYNPADHYINIISIINNEEEAQSAFTEACSLYSKSENIIFEQNCDMSNTMEKGFPTFSEIFLGYKANVFIQFLYIAIRSVKAFYRNPLYVLARFFQDLIFSLIIGLLYYKIELNTNTMINYVGIFFFLSAGLSLTAIVNTIITFPLEIKIYMREHRSHLYRSSVYFLAKTIAELPIHICQVLVTTVIIYFMIGFEINTTLFFYTLAFNVLIYECASSYGYLISAMINSPLIAAALATPMMVPLMIFGGFLLRNDKIPVYLRFIKYISWFQYSFENFVILNFQHAKIKCVKPTCPLSHILFPTLPGSLLTAVLGIHKNDFYFNIGGMIALFAVYRLVSVIIIAFKTNLNEQIRPL